MFIIGGVQKTTLVDFPKKVAAIVFTQSCNFRCGYCHNPELLQMVTSKDYTSQEDFFKFLETRKGKLDGVVITGGEPTLQSGLYDFVKTVKDMGFEVKLDTNGTNPEAVENLLKSNLVDYFAMDIKAPIEKYSLVTGVNVNKENILKSIDLIMNSGIPYEFRTTVVRSQLTFDDFESIGRMISGADAYYLQKFIPSKTYDEKFMTETTYSDDEFKEICKTLKKYVKTVGYR